MVDIGMIYKSNSDYLKAEDIGSDMWTMTIATADVKEFDNGDRKLVLSFDDYDKTLPLNVTNARAIGDLYGTNTEGWAGQQIMLFTMPVDFQGKMVQAIRVRAPQRQTAPPRRQSPQAPLTPPPGRKGGYDDRNPPPHDYADADEIPF